jgi:hypothetical protein
MGIATGEENEIIPLDDVKGPAAKALGKKRVAARAAAIAGPTGSPAIVAAARSPRRAPSGNRELTSFTVIRNPD